jgi:streptomycin 6-kinase
VFEEYLVRWGLVPDGEPIITPTSHLLPVRRAGVPAMLKVATVAEEKIGGQLMVWWDGLGAAQVFAHAGDAIVMERAEGTRSLTEMAHNGSDEEACFILCRAVARLHVPRDHPLPSVILLTEWFRDLEPGAARYGGILSQSLLVSRNLLAAAQEEVALHGDIHHGNVLDFGARGWLAIDPKGLYGERGFDYANIFLNPDGETATAPGQFARRVAIVAAEAGLERQRLLQWILAWSGLSATWTLNDGGTAEIALFAAESAAAELQSMK